MVVKLTLDHSTVVRLFESRVILDGSQTHGLLIIILVIV